MTVIDDLAELLTGGADVAWMRDALCPEYPDTEFFPDRGEPSEPAKAICRSCLVQAECLDYAVAVGGPAVAGIWGGTSGRERRTLITRARPASERRPCVLGCGRTTVRNDICHRCRGNMREKRLRAA